MTQFAMMESANQFNLALKMNGDIGRHIRKNSFTIALTGRFYQNHSLESHRKKGDRLIKLKEKRLALINKIDEEQKKVNTIEENIRRRDIRTKLGLQKIDLVQRGITMLQSSIRRRREKLKVYHLRQQYRAKTFIATFVQRLYRGRLARKQAGCLLEERKINILKHFSSSKIQKFWRCLRAKRYLSELKSQRAEEKYLSALQVQRIWRGRYSRQVFRVKIKAKQEFELKKSAATLIQKIIRGGLAKHKFKKKRTPQKNPSRRRHRRSSIHHHKDGFRRTFVVPSVPKNSSSCWQLIQNSIGTDRARSLVVGPTSRRRSINKFSMSDKNNNKNSDIEYNSEKAQLMMRRLTDASHKAKERHEIEARAEAARQRIIQYKKSHSSDGTSTHKTKRKNVRGRPDSDESIKISSNLTRTLTCRHGGASDLLSRSTRIGASETDDRSIISDCNSSISTNFDEKSQRCIGPSYNYSSSLCTIHTINDEPERDTQRNMHLPTSVKESEDRNLIRTSHRLSQQYNPNAFDGDCFDNDSDENEDDLLL